MKLQRAADARPPQNLSIGTKGREATTVLDCKKRKKEGDHAPVKTITNYFMPMAKVEKAFSPPKSNNIMDYFKKTSPANNKHVVQEKVKENQEKHDVTVKDDKIPVKGVRSLRRGRNVIKKENSSKQLDSVEENSDEVSDVNNDSRDNGLTVGSRILGSETAALLAEICANSYDLQEDTNLNEQPKTALKSKTMKKTKKMQRKPQQLETSSKVLIKEPLENKDSNESPRVTLLPPHNECGKSVCNTSLDVSVNETSCLNDSIVTISFEDFLESQKEVDNLSSPDRSLIKSSDDKDGQKSSPSQVSPRTLTIQAQVHSLAAKSSGSKAQKKIASIFMKKRYVEADPVEVLQVDPPITKTAEQVSKRKSNVVVDEEALELSVIETSTSCLSKPKCTPAEKKQFMNVFKQPPLDVAKNKQKKVQRNPKVPMEKVPKELEVTENTTEETAVRNVLDSEVSGSRGNWSKGVQCVKETTSAQKGKSLKRKGKRNVGKVSSVDDVTPEVLEKTQKPEGRKSEEKEVLQEANLVCTVSSRRLTRGQAKSDAKNLTSLNKRNEENSDVCSSLAGDSPVQMSTPKTTKKGIYRSEMVTAPDEAQSPIRMRFTRVFPRRLLNSGGEDTETLLKNSLVLIEDGDFSKEQRNGKKLRNLNEVLGKSKSKCSKDCTDSKVAPIFLGKKSTKPSVISIFDDSSRDESENSQDDEQFRAKREFLKSGLPDSFKKHIAKKAASELAFSQAAVSFRAVVHILQKQEGSKFWQLTWPESPFLRSLKDDPEMKEMNRHVMTLGEFTYAKSSWTPKTPVVEVSGWRVDLSEEMRQQLLEDIRLANPSFPVQKFFNWFLKRRTEHVLLPSVSGKEANAPNNLPQNAGKRKRKSSVEKESKRSKPNMQDSDVIVIESDTAECVPVRVTRRSRGAKDEVAVQVSGKSRLSRSTRQKEQASVQCENEEIAVKVIQTETDKILEAKLEETAKEDVLWTEKYQPQQSSEIVGNCGAVKKLHSWLKEWKLRTDREESKNQTESKLKDKNDTWDIGDFKEDDSEEENDDFLCNTMLVTGPSGVGKTAAVYACAHELGFKVFEVNASSQRSGRQVLSQLKEATQSHQVDIQGVNTHKPAYFSNPSRSFSGSSTSPLTTYLQLVCLAENLKTNVKDCATLLAWNNCDIRQSLLHLQFWIRSGGSNALVQQTCGQAPPSNEKLHHVPFCDQGSTESLLGLHNNKTSPDLLSFLKSKITSEEQLNDHIRMLAECQDMKLYFTYNNLEFLLPLPVKIIPACGDIPQTDNAREMEDTVHSPMEISKQEDNNQSPDPSPLKLSSRMKRKRMLCLRDDEDLFQSDSEDNFVTLSATHSTSCIEKNATIDLDLVKQQKERHERKPKTSSEKQSCVLVSKTLDSLADFLENVSFLDSSLYTEKNEKEGPYNNGVCCWSAAEIKNGLSDEARIENNVWWHSYSATKMKATVEALSFQRCHMQIDKALNGTLIQCIELGSDSTEEITLPLADHRLGVSLVQQAMCKPSLLRKRSEVMEAITSSRLFANSGSRQVIAVDCLPVLRLICKAEKLREQCKLKRRVEYQFLTCKVDFAQRAVAYHTTRPSDFIFFDTNIGKCCIVNSG
ncbi:ATAD5 protein, partial [Polypterus senegalus]